CWNAATSTPCTAPGGPDGVADRAFLITAEPSPSAAPASSRNSWGECGAPTLKCGPLGPPDAGPASATAGTASTPRNTTAARTSAPAHPRRRIHTPVSETLGRAPPDGRAPPGWAGHLGNASRNGHNGHAVHCKASASARPGVTGHRTAAVRGGL